MRRPSYRPMCAWRTLSVLLMLRCGAAGAGEDAVRPRPRIFFTPERIERLRARVAADERFRTAWHDIRQEAARLLDEELVPREYSEGGRGQHGNYGRPSSQVARMATALGLAYRMTGDARYAEKLRAALLHHGRLTRWAGDAGHDPPWHSELNTARFCFGYAIGYDTLHGFLADRDRDTIRDAMVRLGIRPILDDWVLSETRIHALDSMGHNWWSVCVAMGGLAVLSVLGDEPDATRWVEQVSNAFPEWFAYGGNVLQNKSPNFDRRGAFYESVSYANYALSEYLLFRRAWRDVFPSREPPEIPLLRSVGDFFLHTSYPTSERTLSVNFGDSSLTAHGARTIQLLLANGYEGTGYRWYLSRTDPGLRDPVALVTHDGRFQTSRPAALPSSTWYPDIGWVMLRTSWEDDATLLALKSGFTWNHAHPDAGSFILFQAGKPLIIDSGNCSYSRREYTSYYRQSRAHNVILLDGEAQSPEDCAHGDRGVKTPGSVHRLVDAAGMRYVFADATGPTAWRFARNYRHVLWLEGVILIVDDVRGHVPGQFEWLLHHEGHAEKAAGAIHLSNGERCRAVVTPLYPKGMRLVERTGLRDHDPDTEMAYLALLPEDGLREAKFFTAIAPLGAGNGSGTTGAPLFEMLEATDAVGVRVRHAGLVSDIYLNLRADGRKMHRNSSNTIAGWQTDAYLFAVTHPDGAESASRVFVGCGSYLRRDGTVVLGSLCKVTAIFTQGTPRMEVALSGQPVTNVALSSRDAPGSVVVNGQLVRPQYDGERGTVRISLRTK